VEIPFPDEFRIGNVYNMVVFGLDPEQIEYGYRMSGPWQPETGHRFDASKILLDPYARAIGGRDVWGIPPNWDDVYSHRARLVFDDYDWEGDKPLETPIEDLVIYEMHVRSFTRHATSGVKESLRGTFAGLIEKIPYLKTLGVNCVELRPGYEFDEVENSRPNPTDPGELLMNYWGYSTVGFFAPKAGYAATSKYGLQVDEFKNLVKALHKNGIEVILADALTNPSKSPRDLEKTAETETGPEMHQPGDDHPDHGKANIRSGQIHHQHLQSQILQQAHGIFDVVKEIDALSSRKIRKGLWRLIGIRL